MTNNCKRPSYIIITQLWTCCLCFREIIFLQLTNQTFGQLWLPCCLTDRFKMGYLNRRLCINHSCNLFSSGLVISGRILFFKGSIRNENYLWRQIFPTKSKQNYVLCRGSFKHHYHKVWLDSRSSLRIDYKKLKC